MCSTTPAIRIADLRQPQDAAAVLLMLDRYAADPMGAGCALDAEARACLVPALRSVPGAWVLLAWVGEQPVGIAVCFVGFSTFRARGLFNVHDLAVLPRWRGQGVGRRLLRAVEAEARARGYCKITLEVRADNGAAMALYRRLGFGAGVGAREPAQYLFMERRLGA
ncbi:MAG: GNAT family N-acetyltransferase [Anderseniella sp.]|nr:GNAT family N-acetyltransferase [Anderseniella sp.]